MLSLGTCNVCQTGPRGLRKCGVCRRVVLLCEECDAAWPTSAPAARPTFEVEGQMPCPWCSSSLRDNGSTWATREEAATLAWVGDLNDLQEGSAFGTD